MLSRCDILVSRWHEAIRRYREKMDLQRELSGELSPYRRLIVVTGMARSGTSVTAAFLGSHPEVKLVIGGGCWQVCETDLIRMEMGEPDWRSIDELLRDNYPKRILLKQPWVMNNWMFARAIRPAKIVVCLRERRSQIGGWQNRRDMVSERCQKEPDTVYNECISHLPRLLSEGATWVHQDQMDAEMAQRVGRHLGLEPAGFDLSILGRRWKEAMEKDWLDKHTIRKERRRP